ncbi:MAG: molybdopterin-dependent oxidoreductase [Caulobacteraceae bacterium]|nr:molybdopterin-dependent oxidoreductase [Caulobacteraceae bacterium]
MAVRSLSLLAAAASALCLAGAAHGQAPSPITQALTIKGPDGRTATVTDAQLRDMHRFSVTAGFGEHHVYAGAPVSDLLALVGGPSDVKLHGPPLDQIVIVTGSDGFIAVLSIAETARSFRDAPPTILADEVDGKPLDPKEGPYRLVIGGELKASRSVRTVTTIELRPVH